jgi:hypothetical protein
MSSNQLAAFNYGVPPYANLPIKSVTAAYLVQPNDNGWIVNCTSGAFTIALPAAGTLPVGFNCRIWNTSSTSTDAITIDPAGTETIDGVSTLILRRGEGLQIVCNGTNWQIGDKKTMRGYAENIAATSTRPIASADNSTAIGGNSSSQGSQAVTGSGAMALGGSYASGSNSFAAAVASNSSSYGATGANSAALLQNAKAANSACVAIGGSAFANGTYAFAFGQQSWADQSYSYAFGGSAYATAQYSYAIGFQAEATAQSGVAIGRASKSTIIGKYAYASAEFSAAGDAQTGTFVLRRATTDATATVLTTNSSTASTNNQVILPNNSAYAFTGIVVARRQASGGTDSAAWKIEGLIRREGAANTTTLVASTVTAIDNTPGWTLALSADTTNGGLKVEATGAASTNIRWVATVQTSEVTYA